MRECLYDVEHPDEVNKVKLPVYVEGAGVGTDRNQLELM